MAKKHSTPGPKQHLPGVKDALAYRSAQMDMLVVTALFAGLGILVGGTISAQLLGGSPWFFGKPFLPRTELGFNLYTILPDIIALVKYRAFVRVEHAAMLGIAIFIAFVIAGWALGAKKASKSRQRLLTSDAHGSAHWATLDEIVEAGMLPDPKAEKPADSRHVCYVGGWLNGDRLEYLRHTGPEHVIAFAPTRSGKGVGLVIPTLLAWRGSVVVHDIKGENWALTSGWRQSIGQRCLKFAPTLSDGTSCRFNPLSEIRVGTDKEVADVQNIATMVVDPDGKGLNDHWAKTGFALLVGSILHVLYSRDIQHKTLKSVANLLANPAVASVDEIFEVMKSYEHDPDGRMGWIDLAGNPTKTHPVVAESAQEMLNKADNEKSGVISTAMSFLSLYRDPVVAANIECSDFRIGDLMGDKNLDAVPPVSLYLVVPPSDKDRLKPLIRLVLNQIVRRLTESMEFKDGRSVESYQHRLLLMIDEFPSLGKLDIFAESLAYVAGYGMKMYLICQDTAQLYAAYGKDEAIIANCHVRVVFTPNRIETAEWLSKILGKRTLVTENTTFSYNGQFMPYQTGMSGGLQYQARELLTPDEVMSLKGPTKDAKGNINVPGDMITLVAGKAPVYGTQMLYYKDPVFKKRASIESPDHAGIVAKGDSTAPVVSSAAAQALGDEAKQQSKLLGVEPEAAAQVPPTTGLDALDGLDEKGAQPAPAQPQEARMADMDAGALLQSAAQEAALHQPAGDAARGMLESKLIMDRLRGMAEIELRDAAFDTELRKTIEELPAHGEGRLRMHRAKEKTAFDMLAGV